MKNKKLLIAGILIIIIILFLINILNVNNDNNLNINFVASPKETNVLSENENYVIIENVYLLDTQKVYLDDKKIKNIKKDGKPYLDKDRIIGSDDLGLNANYKFKLTYHDTTKLEGANRITSNEFNEYLGFENNSEIYMSTDINFEVPEKYKDNKISKATINYYPLLQNYTFTELSENDSENEVNAIVLIGFSQQVKLYYMD